MPSVPTLRELTLGEVLDVSFGLYRSLFAPLLTVAVICQAIPALLNVYLSASGDPFSNLGLTMLYVLLAVVLGALGVAASTFLVSDAYLGREVSPSAALGRAMSLLGRLVAISLLSSVLIGFGLVLLVIPGLLLLSGLVLSTVVGVLENPDGPITAMSRSWELTRGYRTKVLLAVFVAFLLLMLPAIALGGALGWFGDSDGPLTMIVLVAESVLQIFVYPFVYVVLTVLYYDLRIRKEGFDLELLSSSLPEM